MLVHSRHGDNVLVCYHRDNSIFFREYVKRLKSHKCCQKLQLQSFLLLPMQRITRMPLLILNILNRISLQHKDRKVVEDALRVIQSVSSGHYLKLGLAIVLFILSLSED